MSEKTATTPKRVFRQETLVIERRQVISEIHLDAYGEGEPAVVAGLQQVGHYLVHARTETAHITDRLEFTFDGHVYAVSVEPQDAS